MAPSHPLGDTPVPNRLKYPPSGVALGVVVDALHLRPLVEQRPGVSAKSMQRFLAGEIVKDDTRGAVIAAVIDVVFDDDLHGALAFTPEEWSEVRKALHETLAMYLRSWDQAAGYLNSSSAPLARREHALLLWARFTIMDLAIRWGAFLRAAGWSGPGSAVVEAAAKGRAFDAVLRAEKERSRLTWEALRTKANLAESTMEEWLAGRALPRLDSVVSLAAAVSAPGDAADWAATRLRMQVALAGSALVRAFAAETDEEWAASYLATFLDLGDHTYRFIGNSKLDQPRLQRVLWKLIVHGARADSAQVVLRNAARMVHHEMYRDDLLAVQGDWTERLSWWVRHISRPEGAAARLGPVYGLPQDRARGAIELAHRMMLVMPPLGSEEAGGLYAMIAAMAETDPRMRDGWLQEEASKRTHEGDHSGAEPHYRELVAMQEGNAMYHFWLGACLGQQGKFEEAVLECRVAAQLHPGWGLPVVEVGIIEVNTGRVAEGVATLKAAAESFEVTDHHAHSLGYALMLLERHQEAATWFLRALALSSERATTMNCLAHCLLTMGSRQEGRRWAKEAAHRGFPQALNALEAGAYGR